MVAAAVVGGGALGAVGSAVSGNEAAGAQEDAANSANATQLQMYNNSKQILQPFVNAGQGEIPAYQSALSNLSGIQPFSFNGNDLSSNPGFQFANTQGLKAVTNANAAQGLGMSGAQVKGAEQFSTGLANQYYNDYYNQALNSYNTNYNVASGKASALAGAVQLGGNAAAGQATNAVNTGTSLGANTIGAGNAEAAGNIATGNAISSAASSVGSGALLNQILGGQQASTAYAGSGGASAGSNSYGFVMPN